MVIEILFQEVCGLYGDSQNPVYLQKTLPDAEFIFTSLTDTPYFVDHKPDMIYIGCMSESTQRKVIAKLLPFKDRIQELVDQGIVFLATGNAGEIFAKKIDYVTEETSIAGLGLFDLQVQTNFFKRYNGKVLGKFNGFDVVGFRSQFSFLYGDNSNGFFLSCERGCGINKQSTLEGMRKNNLICTQLLGPVLPLNPLLCEYLIELTGNKAEAAFRTAAMNAYHARLQEFRNPSVNF